MGETTAGRKLDPEVEKIVKEIGIPPCPRVILEFMEEMRREEPDFRKISALVSSDAALAAAVIKTANSPAYGLRNKATTVQQATMYLGLRSTALLISGLLLRRAFPVDNSKALDRLWDLSAATSVCAATLAPKYSGVDRDTAHTFALFRDCGQAALYGKYLDYTGIIDGSARKPGVPITTVELARYGLHHGVVSSVLAQTWELPEMLCDAIRHHHDYAALASGKLNLPRGAARLIALGTLAEHLQALQNSGPGCAEWPLAKEFVAAELGVRDEHLPPLAALIAETRETAAA